MQVSVSGESRERRRGSRDRLSAMSAVARATSHTTAGKESEVARTSLAKNVFALPSAEVTASIETSDKVQELRAAGFKFEAALRELERMFETRAAELRAVYLEDVDRVNGIEE